MAEITATESTYDYSMIGSVGGDAAQSVNGDMINKIRAAEEKSIIDPISKKIENIDLEKEKMDAIKTAISEFKDLVSYFELTNEENVFEQYNFDTTGTSAVFDTVNNTDIEEGTVEVKVAQLAQKDVYQSSQITGVSKTDTMSEGQGDSDSLTIAVSDQTYTFNSKGKTYESFANEINAKEEIQASVEAVGTDDSGDTIYRLVIKSAESGEDNALTITQNGLDLGYDDEASSHILTAQNMQATVDGVEYDVSSNELVFQNGIKMTALKVDEGDDKSTVTISQDSSAVTVAADVMVEHYNSLNDLINDELYSADSPIEDKSTLRTIQSDIKAMLFTNYGAREPEFGDEVDEYGDTVYKHSNVTNNEINIFSLGFSLDQSGQLSLDKVLFNEIISGQNENYNFKDLKYSFTGVYENQGLGVQLSEYFTSLDSYNGLFDKYDTSIVDKKSDLEDDKEDEVKRLDAKYGIMADQFTQYSAMIAQMEASFSGMKMMIAQSTSKS